MRGKSSIALNQATMIEAIQLYFDTILFKQPVRVISVSRKTDSCKGYSDTGDLFTVDFEEGMPAV